MDLLPFQVIVIVLTQFLHSFKYDVGSLYVAWNGGLYLQWCLGFIYSNRSNLFQFDINFCLWEQISVYYAIF